MMHVCSPLLHKSPLFVTHTGSTAPDGVSPRHYGWFRGDTPHVLGANVVWCCVLFGWTMGMMYPFFWILKKFDLLRISREEELVRFQFDFIVKTTIFPQQGSKLFAPPCLQHTFCDKSDCCTTFCSWRIPCSLEGMLVELTCCAHRESPGCAYRESLPTILVRGHTPAHATQQTGTQLVCLEQYMVQQPTGSAKSCCDRHQANTPTHTNLTTVQGTLGDERALRGE